MEIITVETSGLKFCIPTDGNKVRPNPALINWCAQFLTPESTFVDIGPDGGDFSVVLSKSCRHVHVFESISTHYDALHVTLCLNNVFSAEIHPESLGRISSAETTPLDEFKIEGIGLIRIHTPTDLEILHGASATLGKNNFPPLILYPTSDTQEDLFNYIRLLGYKLHPISGSNGSYLASDHPMRSPPKSESSSSEIDSNLAEMLARYNDEEPMEDLTDADWLRLATHFRVRSKHTAAYECAHRGLTLTVSEPMKYRLVEEISIVAFYIDQKLEGLRGCEDLILTPHTNWNSKNQALGNISFYLTEEHKLPVRSHRKMEIPFPSPYSSSSSSLIPCEYLGSHGLIRGYQMILRGVNYSIAPGGNYIMRHEDNVVRTMNLKVQWNNQMEMVSTLPLENQFSTLLHSCRVEGLEDLRMMGDRYFLCTCLQLNSQGHPQIGWGTYDAEGKITRLVPLTVDANATCEKNWLPFMQNGELKFIYTAGPLRIYTVDFETGEVKLTTEVSPSKFDLREFRGSASPIPFFGGWLWTVHQVHYSQPRKYYHRFVWWNSDFTQIKFSRMWFFQKVGIEFNLGLCPVWSDTSELNEPKEVILTYSVNDATSEIVTVDSELISTWLSDYSETIEN